MTEPGKLFYMRACALCTDLRSSMQEVSSFQENVKGKLRIHSGLHVPYNAMSAVLAVRSSPAWRFTGSGRAYSDSG